MSEADVRRGEIYYISLDSKTTGSEQLAGRPAVIVSCNVNNIHSSVVELVYLTKQEKTPLTTHVFIQKGACAKSTILCEQIHSVSKLRIGDYVTTLNDEEMEEVDQALLISLALEEVCRSETKEEVPQHQGQLEAQLISLRSEAEKVELNYKALIEEHKTKIREVHAKDSEIRFYKEMYDNLLNKLLETK